MKPKLFSLELNGVTHIGPASELARFYGAVLGLVVIHTAPRPNGEKAVCFYSAKSNIWQECGTFIDRHNPKKNQEAAFETFFMNTAVQDGVATEVSPELTLYHLLQGDLSADEPATDEEPTEGEPTSDGPESDEPEAEAVEA